ncbi:MAG: ThiF family adenylyltransferase [Hoeflea sp.]|uniref:shikimate dehydrogenase family protein n=1 Tax=Hoeflea sp. TaxID=1940281 RepID=UPI003296DE1B
MNIITPKPSRAGSVDFVDGHTRLYGILGHPIEQVRTPETVTYELRRRGINAIVLPIHVRPEELDDCIPGLMKIANLDGLVVTIPHKKTITGHLDRIGPLAEISGSASVIARSKDDKWVGEMFDGNGCVSAMLRRGVELAGKHVFLLGAGGAGVAIASTLARTGVAQISLQDPDAARSADLHDRIGKWFPNVVISRNAPSLDEIDVLINASSVGMLDASRIPIDIKEIPERVVVMDAIMDPDRTRLIALAEECGCATVYGREMLDSQIEVVSDFLLDSRDLLAADIKFP